MKRRQFTLGLGAAVVGSGVTLGSGAFSNVEADRSVSVNVVDDDDAYLALESVTSDGRVYSTREENGETVGFSFPGLQEDTTGEGLGEDSEYWFDDLLRISNQGNKDVVVYSEYNDDTLADVALYRSDNSGRDSLTAESTSEVISPGESFVAGLYIDTDGVPARDEEFDTSVTVVGEETG